jgi:phage portal protein BeeE
MLRPEWVTVMMGSQYDAEHPAEAPDTELLGYLYKPPNGKATLFEPFEIAHYAPIPDPDSVFLGMSWITPVLTDVMGDDAALTHKRKFFQNAATPNLGIKFDPSVSIEQVREFKALLEEEHRGAWNAYKTLYLGGGADPITLGKDFAQMEFAVTQGKGESRLASAAGVPPSWVGFSEGLQGSALNAGNFGAARRRFGDGTMQHLWANACASLATIVRPAEGSRAAGADLWFSSAGVPFLREDSKDAAEIQGKEAATIAALIREGFEAESVVKAVQNGDWSLLKHSGLLSVQLQPPGQQPPTQPSTPAAPQEGNADV